MKKGEDYPGVTVVYWCHDGNGNYLFNKRGTNCRDEQGRWDCGGGSLDLGDTVEETLRKEIKEEYCTDVLESEFLGYRDILRENVGKKTQWVALDFRVLVDRETVANGEPHKFDEVAWFKLDELPERVHSQLNVGLEKYKDKLA